MKKKWKFTKKAACKAARFLSLLITLFVLQWTCSIGLPGGSWWADLRCLGPLRRHRARRGWLRRKIKAILCLR